MRLISTMQLRVLLNSFSVLIYGAQALLKKLQKIQSMENDLEDFEEASKF